MLRHIFWLIIALFTHYSPNVFAGELPPEWEFGLGIGGLSVPHYRGSDQTEEYAAPIPYLRYYGKRLKVDREGAHFYFLKTGKFTLDISAGFNFPVNSNENRARQGMPELDSVVELGPRAQFEIYESTDQHMEIQLAFPLRVAITVDLHGPDNTGWIFPPYVQFMYYAGWDTSFSIGPMWASEKYHDYYYQVAPVYATTDRPEYDARAGYNGFRYTLTTSTRLNKRIWFGLFARYDDMTNAVFADSPLVKQLDSLFIGIGIAYIFKSSSMP